MRKLCRLTSRALLAAPLAVPIAGQADDYRWEAGGSFERTTVDFPGFEFHIDNWALYGTYFFRDVDTGQLPLQEAAYLQRTGSVSLTPSRLDSDFGHLDQWRLASDVYVPRYWLYLGAGVTRVDIPDTAGVISTGDETAWDATIGVTPFAGLRLTTSFYEDQDYQPNAEIKYVGKFGNDHYFGLGANLVDPDGFDLTYGVSADYYIDRTLRVGAEMIEDAQVWGVSVDKFFMEKLRVGLEYTDFDGANSYEARAAWRF